MLDSSVVINSPYRGTRGGNCESVVTERLTSGYDHRLGPSMSGNTQTTQGYYGVVSVVNPMQRMLNCAVSRKQSAERSNQTRFST